MAFMLERNSVMASMVMVVLVAAGVVYAQSDCQTLITSLAPCLNFVTGSASTPSAACCTAFGSVVKTNATCLCQIINGSSGIAVNQTKALELPQACNVATPPISNCQTGVQVPSTSPSASGPSSNNVPPPTEGSSPNAGALFTPSLVTIVSMMGVVLMKNVS